jgi:hypothetical protein
MPFVWGTGGMAHVSQRAGSIKMVIATEPSLMTFGGLARFLRTMRPGVAVRQRSVRRPRNSMAATPL